MAYSKLFSSIVHSSLWTEEDHVRLLFVTLLAIADREGYVYGSRMGLERLANIDYDDDDRNPWQALMDPDSDSSDLMRNPENEGRRIEEVPGGFHILNFLYYRSLRNEDDRRKTNREAKQRQRARESAKVNQCQPASAKVSQSLPISDADADAEYKKKKTSSCTTSSSYLEDLKKNPIHALIDIDRELEKAGQWCKKKNRKLTQRFFNNWLKNADRSIPMPKAKSQPMAPVNDTPPDEREKILAAGRAAVGKLSQQFKTP